MPWADLNDVRLYYETAGDGEPLLLITGLGATCRLWDPIVPELSNHFSMILPDNRDVGKSLAKRTPRTLSDLASDLIELLDLLQVDRAHVMGISFGGVLAQTLAIEHPSRINRLVLLSTAHRFGPYLRDVSSLLGRCLAKMSFSNYQRTVELLGTAPAYYDAHVDEVNQKIETARRQHTPKQAVFRQLKCLAVSEVSEPYFRIAAPTLVIAGEYDAMIPNCYSRRMADAIPGAEFHILADCGHNPVIEMPAAITQLTSEFLLRKTAPSRAIATNGISAEIGKRFRDRRLEASYHFVQPESHGNGAFSGKEKSKHHG